MEISIRDFAYTEASELHYGSYNHLVDANLDKEDTEDDEINGQAVALFDFTPENDNEIALRTGQVIWINYRYGQGWLVAEDGNGDIGLIPEEYVQLERQRQEDDDFTEPKQMFEGLMEHESDWEDEGEVLSTDEESSERTNEVIDTIPEDEVPKDSHDTDTHTIKLSELSI
jgi:hypothetical protein